MRTRWAVAAGTVILAATSVGAASCQKLAIVEGAGHNQSLTSTWPAIERWLDEVLPPSAL